MSKYYIFKEGYTFLFTVLNRKYVEVTFSVRGKTLDVEKMYKNDARAKYRSLLREGFRK